jgi:hypothetical protein
MNAHPSSSGRPLSVICAFVLMFVLTVTPAALWCLLVSQGGVQTVSISKQAIIPAAPAGLHHQNLIFLIDHSRWAMVVTDFFRFDALILLLLCLLSLPLGGLILARFSWPRFFYAGLVLLALPIPFAETQVIGWMPLLYCLTSVVSVVLLFLPASNRWFLRA